MKETEAPTLATAHEALSRLYGPHTADVWRTLLFSAGLAVRAAAFARLAASGQESKSK